MKFPSFNLRQVCVFITVTLFSIVTQASVVINGTRVIYHSDAKEVSVKISNNGPLPVLLQSWIDNGDANAKPSTIKVPFVLTPPMNRVASGKGQTLRISYVGDALPADRESVFWLNVLEVPAKSQAKSEENRLQMAFRSRIKLFYRPVGLEGNANDAAKALSWNAQNNRIQVTNPTPYYVSLVNITVNSKKIAHAMLTPHSTIPLDLPGKAGDKVIGSFVNDYGAVNALEVVMK